MPIDLSINLGNILTIFTFILGGIVFVITIKTRVEGISLRIESLERHIEKIADIMLVQGVQQERMNGIDARLNAVAVRLDGYITKIDELYHHVNKKE